MEEDKAAPEAKSSAGNAPRGGGKAAAARREKPEKPLPVARRGDMLNLDRGRLLFRRTRALQAVLLEARLLGIQTELVSAAHMIVSLKYKGQAALFRGTASNYSTPLTTLLDYDLCNYKVAAQKLLEELGYPVPESVIVGLKNSRHRLQARYADVRGDTAEEIVAEMEDLLPNKLNFPESMLVVKPEGESYGIGVMCAIQNREMLVHGLEQALTKCKRSPLLIVQQHVTGRDYRIYVIDYEICAVMCRTPACVVGDGRHNIRELIEIENKNPRRGVGHTCELSLLRVDPDLLHCLSTQGLSLEDVPAAAHTVPLHHVANITSGGTPYDFTDEIHPSFAEKVRQMARDCGLRLVGIDICTPDIGKDCDSQPWWVLELNARPNPRPHLNKHGNARNVIRATLGAVFPALKDERVYWELNGGPAPRPMLVPVNWDWFTPGGPNPSQPPSLPNGAAAGNGNNSASSSSSSSSSAAH